MNDSEDMNHDMKLFLQRAEKARHVVEDLVLHLGSCGGRGAVNND